jgi:hypothetical protein
MLKASETKEEETPNKKKIFVCGSPEKPNGNKL